MDRKDIDQQAKKDFSSKINEQVGRTSRRELTVGIKTETGVLTVSYKHLRAKETDSYIV